MTQKTSRQHLNALQAVCSACGHRENTPPVGPMAGQMSADVCRCPKCRTGVMQITVTVKTTDG